MIATRRAILAGGGALAAAAALPLMFRASGAPVPALPPGDLLLIHEGGQSGLRLRAASQGRPVREERIVLLTMAGFRHAADVLDHAHQRTIAALLDDGPAIVAETMLSARGAQAIRRSQVGGQVLLTARL